MSSRGRFGITRDNDGSLSSVYEWPWFWRYPAMLAALSFTGVVAFHVYGNGGGSAPLWSLGVAAVGVILSLSISYELGCLVLAAAILYGGYLLISWLIPDSWETPSWAGWVAGIALAYWLGKVIDAQDKRITELAKQVQELRHRLDSRPVPVSAEDFYDFKWRIEERVDDLEGPIPLP